MSDGQITFCQKCEEWGRLAPFSHFIIDYSEVVMSLLFPDVVYNRIVDVPLSELSARGIKGIILDIDNTLTTHDNPVPATGVMQWLDEAREQGFQLIILSNNSAERSGDFAARLGLAFQGRGKKPLPFGYRRCCKRMGIAYKEATVIGDQIFTDILGGKLLGIYSILVEPIELEDMPFFKFKRKLERLLMKRYQNQF